MEDNLTRLLRKKHQQSTRPVMDIMNPARPRPFFRYPGNADGLGRIAILFDLRVVYELFIISVLFGLCFRPHYLFFEMAVVPGFAYKRQGKCISNEKLISLLCLDSQEGALFDHNTKLHYHTILW